MFWTIVGALLFFSIGIPIIVMLIVYVGAWIVGLIEFFTQKNEL